MRLALITDQHFGPRAHFAGTLRKLSDRAASLCQLFVERMNTLTKPDLVINLGDVVEDESPELDRLRYEQFLQIMQQLTCPILHVAGNHDSKHLSDETLATLTRAPGSLYYSQDSAGFHLIVLRSVERTGRDVRLPDEQLEWLADDLERTTLPALLFVHHPLSDMQLDGNRWFEKAPQLCRVANRRAVREVIEQSGKVRAVFNGHAHWNHLDLVAGVPYVTLQSLIENVDDDAPGRPAASHAIVDASSHRIVVTIEGLEPARYQFDSPRTRARAPARSAAHGETSPFK